MTATLTDADRAAGLRRMKVVATGMLVAAAVVFLIANTADSDAAWIGYVVAAAEAAMVGALADWFAVTALFRHPLGIPIPHTAIIPKRKDQIGRSLGEFVEQNFLTHDVLGERLADAHIGQRLGTWLAQPDNARRAADGLADALRGTLEVLDDAEVQAGLERVIESQVRATPAAPMFGRAIDLAMEGGHHQRLLDAVLVGLGGFMEDNRTTFRHRLETESPWWIPESIDNRIFEKIYSAVHSFIGDVGADPDHEVRQHDRRPPSRLRDRLRHDPVLLAKGEELKDELLAHPDVREWLASLWGEAKRAMIAAAGDENSELRLRMTSSLRSLGDRLSVDEELQHKVDDWVMRTVGYVIDHYRNEVSDMIAGTVERWDADTTSRKMELQVGRDLQFIRINGTIVGGLAGVVIHAVGNVIG